jgi:hypothetical protein
MTELKLLDILLTLVHFIIIGFNLLGWIWKRTRQLHFIVVCTTAACWFILGIWFGIGYCPITDWDWQIKEKLGEHDLPNSFIKYYADMIVGHSVNANLIDILTAAGFFMAAILSVYFNFIKKKVFKPQKRI